MSPQAATHRYTRVVIAFAVSAPAPFAIEAGLGLAEAVGASLEGLFVEDSALLRLAALPLARETSSVTGTQRAMAADEIERAMRVEAARRARLLAESAARAQVPWTFAVARGELVPEAVTRDADLIVLSAREHPGGETEAGAASAPLAVLYDASAASSRALYATAQLATALRREVVVLVPGEDAARAKPLHADASAWLAGERLRGRIVTLASGRGALRAAVRRARIALLVLPFSALEAWPGDAEHILGRVGCPLVLAR